MRCSQTSIAARRRHDVRRRAIPRDRRLADLTHAADLERARRLVAVELQPDVLPCGSAEPLRVDERGFVLLMVWNTRVASRSCVRVRAGRVGQGGCRCKEARRRPSADSATPRCSVGTGNQIGEFAGAVLPERFDRAQGLLKYEQSRRTPLLRSTSQMIHSRRCSSGDFNACE
ncbi:hypothetical protein L1887_55588 [Cichorium endivia]|nr:hypothetical protein L1887_55588 [Cichorium endivia]